jgi:glucose/arabinose dehydrogenase
VIGVLLVALVIFLLYLRFVIGVNLPIGEGKLDKEKLEQQIELPDGFSIGLYATDVPNARILRFSRAGDLLVANPSLDKITILGRDKNGDGKADSSAVLLDDLNGPNGLDFYEDWLYVAETDAIGRIKFDHENGAVVGEYERIVTGLPAGGNHWKKTLRFGPDGLMYVSMGSSCNVCIEQDQRRAAMIRYQPDGSADEIFAEGMRNSAGFDWSPIDGKIYATDNGRDLLGNDFPPCELNLIEQGNHYGWPYANGDKIPDPDFGEGNEDLIARSISPVHDFRAHNAPLGMEFVRGTSFPEEYRGAAIVALHGSWNRTDKDGYKVVSLHWDENGNITERDFVSGFLRDDNVIGRPAEVTQGPDGAFYIADDYVGVIYRVAYGEEQTTDVSITLPVMKSADKALPEFDAETTLTAYDDKDKEKLLGEGMLLYRQFGCISCHNPDGAGLKVLENLGSKYDVATMSRYLQKPKPPMPIFPLSESDREAISLYLISNY